mmetsp:Transcript_55491/g.104361  ORF Transcript_55491/g.104361 Transcript_55491/m.104361 type:complete len:290 (+) Transcript_55491:47-916(+)
MAKLALLMACCLAHDPAVAFNPASFATRSPVTRRSLSRSAAQEMNAAYDLESPDNAWLLEEGSKMMKWEELVDGLANPVVMVNRAKNTSDLDRDFDVSMTAGGDKSEEISQAWLDKNVEVLRSHGFEDEWIPKFVLKKFPQIIRYNPDNFSTTVTFLDKKWGRQGFQWMVLSNPELLGYSDKQYQEVVPWLMTMTNLNETQVERYFCRDPKLMQAGLNSCISSVEVGEALAGAFTASNTMLKSLVTDVTNTMKKSQDPLAGTSKPLSGGTPEGAPKQEEEQAKEEDALK